MTLLLKLSQLIDLISERVGKGAFWLVLVMTIANYGSQPLEGVKFDGRNALEIAQRLGYDTSQATVLKDGQLTSQGLKEAIGQLSTQVQRNDRG